MYDSIFDKCKVKRLFFNSLNLKSERLKGELYVWEFFSDQGGALGVVHNCNTAKKIVKLTAVETVRKHHNHAMPKIRVSVNLYIKEHLNEWRE